MYFISKNGSHAPKAKSTALIIAIVLILVMAVGGTVAYIVTHTEPVINQFTPTEAKITVVEDIKDNVKNSITVKNDSTGVPVYIRVALVANAIDDNGTVTGKAEVPVFTPGTGWVKIGEYYYYTSAVEVGDSTGNLLSGKMTLEANTQVIVVADAIQATPIDAVKAAWGETIANELTKGA